MIVAPTKREAALSERPRLGWASRRKLEAKGEAYLPALARSEPPEGREREGAMSVGRDGCVALFAAATDAREKAGASLPSTTIVVQD